MKLEGAVIREQGVTFAIAVVKKAVLDSPTRRGEAAAAMQPLFPGKPLVLMAQDTAGRAHYFGRNDLVQFMSTVPLSAVPWKQYEVR